MILCTYTFRKDAGTRLSDYQEIEHCILQCEKYINLGGLRQKVACTWFALMGSTPGSLLSTVVMSTGHRTLKDEVMEELYRLLRVLLSGNTK